MDRYDGRWLTYASVQGSDGGDMNIWLQRLSEPGPGGGPIEPLGPPIQITSDPGNQIEPALSPDGGLLAYCTTGTDTAVHLLALDQEATPGEAIRIGAGGRGPKFSPDDQLITWWVGTMSRQHGIRSDFDYSIWSLPIDADRAVVTGEIACVAPNPAMDMIPSVSTDGGRLVFHSLRGDSYNIWYQEGDADARRLTAGPAQKGYPAISQDGSQVVYGELHRPTTSGQTASEQTLRVIDLERESRPARSIAIELAVAKHGPC